MNKHFEKDQLSDLISKLQLLMSKDQKEDSFLTSDALKTYMVSLQKLMEILRFRKVNTCTEKVSQMFYAEVASHFEPTIQLLKEVARTLNYMCFLLIQKDFKCESSASKVELELITNEIKVLSDKGDHLLNWVNVGLLDGNHYRGRQEVSRFGTKIPAVDQVQ